MRFFIVCTLLFSFFSSCRKEEKKFLFKTLTSEHTGLAFENRLQPSPTFNMFKYMYFYNGAGIGAGDFNQDGLIDLFFSANQSANKFFINQGNLRFQDVTSQAGLTNDGGWSTGVSVVDINADGLLDIYVCRVSGMENLTGKNELWINQGVTDGIPHFVNQAKEYGLDYSGYCTQAAFFDYDRDGDLDMFLLNHAIDQNGTFAPRHRFLGTYADKVGDRMYRNDGNHFTDVTSDSKINSSAISFGLGVVVTDINLDGWPDLYVGNDFHENDYLYINQKDGTFADESSSRMMHTSMYSMGVDAADYNNDGLTDIVTMDMLPSDPYMIRRSLAEDDYDIYHYKIKTGYSYQYTRNNLQLNRGNGVFSEIGTYAGIYATDWSWSTLWVDFDNDGWKDLFVSNGIPKRMNDIDYVNFVSNREIQEKLRANHIEQKDMALVNKFPEIKLVNRFFKNTRDYRLADISHLVENNTLTFSNGAVYADLDRDGDLDMVVSNIDDRAMVYENLSSTEKSKTHYLDLRLKGSGQNINALGAKIFAFAGNEIQAFENFPVRGFQSSMQVPVHVGLSGYKVDSIAVVWPDNTFQKIDPRLRDTLVEVVQSTHAAFNYEWIHHFKKNSTQHFEDVTRQLKIDVVHEENSFPEFTREPLIPKMISTDGPALAIADINHDGLEDIFLGSSKTSTAVILLQEKTGTFKKIIQPELEKDLMNEEVDACWTDVNRDGHLDLVIANGGNEFFGKDAHLSPVIYLNDGSGLLKKKENAFENIFVNASRICPFDFDGDGDTDFFLAGRSVPWEYGMAPSSYMLENDGNGKFVDVTASIAPALAQAGMITDARWQDVDGDGHPDLLTCEDWGGINLYVQRNGKFERKTITKRNGWWNFVLPLDIDQDGDIDIIAGNQGLNSKLKASAEQPVRLYYNDFDDNGKKEQIVTYYVEGEEIPFMGKGDLQRWMPMLKKKFLYAADYAQTPLRKIFSPDKLDHAKTLSVDYFANAVLLNDGKGNFTLEELPPENQFSCLKAGVSPAPGQVMLFGNFYQNNIQIGRNDADYGSLLVRDTSGKIHANLLNGLILKGQVRHVAPISIKGVINYVLAMNNDSLRVIKPSR
ncbi:MAG: VCBS repeat-containing protein [Bacteroidetes bacterium]|nr:VCBS repeat-containing protein [Bacteroidota bacterium]MBS1541819.1 VCBS repeat-containing protein [Bacteroidota bacterium]